jgi:hypothetical protein
MTRGYAALAVALVAFAGRAGADEKLVPVSGNRAGGCQSGAGCNRPAAPAPCGSACRPCGRGLLEQLRDWFTYRACAVPCGCTCWAPKVHICYPPLYTFFLHERGDRCRAPVTCCDTGCGGRDCRAPATCGEGGCAGRTCHNSQPPRPGLLQR